MVKQAKSHSVWVRGLKLSLFDGMSCGQIVALRVGAWIETQSTVDFGKKQ